MSLATKLGPTELVPVRLSKLKPGHIVWHNSACGVVKKVRRDKESGCLLVSRDGAPRILGVDDFEVLVEIRRREHIVRGSTR